jgi:RNA polymerase sigma-70 factor, ECF subfamily
MEQRIKKVRPFAAVVTAGPVDSARPQPPATNGPHEAEKDLGHTDELAQALPRLLPRLWRFALRLTGDQHDAEDLVQRACLRALEREHQLRPGTSALSWLFSIAHSVWLNEVRARKIRSHRSIQWSEELAETVADPCSPDPDTSVLYEQIVSAVARLPDAQRVVLLLVAVEGMSYREAASVLGVPIGTVMSRLARARLTVGEAVGVLSQGTSRTT